MNNSFDNMNSGMNMNMGMDNMGMNNMNMNNMNINNMGMNNMNNMGMNNINNMGMNNMNNMGMNNMNNQMYYNQMGMNNFGMNQGMNMYSMYPMNPMMNNNMNSEDQNLFRLKFLLGNIQQYLYYIMNDINEVENILTNMKNEGSDNNPNFLMLRNQFNQMMNNFNNNNMMNMNTKFSIIFRRSGKNVSSSEPPIMLQVDSNEKMRDIIRRYKEKSNDFDDKNKYIFNARNINLDLSASEIGLSNNANIFVVKPN
jgi:hypothetical protein